MYSISNCSFPESLNTNKFLFSLIDLENLDVGGRIILKWIISCKEIFIKLGILTLYSQYIFSTLTFVVKHKDLFTIILNCMK
jgi:hypothetical protein